ncbi:unnamed protein product [Absidia cylindrospora]
MTFTKKDTTLHLHHEIKTRKGRVLHERYRNICTLGKGNFGKVFLAEDMSTGDQVAIKVVDKRLFKNNDQKQHAQREQSICEEFATDLMHKNIVQIFEVVADEECIYVVMEYVQGGELFERIKQDQKLAEPLARRWFREIIEAVCYIHENGIVHRDLKPENAPEMVTATPYNGPPVDMWSCGVILYAMLTGTLPFQGDDMPQLFRKISHGIYVMPRFISSDAAHLINRLLCKNAKDRITAAACLDHPWFKSSTSSVPLSSSSSASIRRSGLLYSNNNNPSPHHHHHHHRLSTISTISKKEVPSLSSSVQKHRYNHHHPHEKQATQPNAKLNYHQSSVNTTVADPNATAITSQRHKKSTSPFRFIYTKKHTQVVPSVTPENTTEQKLSPQKKRKAHENKMMHRFKDFFKSAFQKRIR